MHFNPSPAQGMLTLVQLGCDELSPGLSVARALSSQIHVIRADYIIGGQQPELGAQDVPGQSARSRIPAAPLKQRAGEQVAGGGCDRILCLHAPDEDYAGA